MNATYFPASTKSPEEVIDEHARAIADAAKRLVAQNETFRRREIDLNTRLADALERVHELETKVREKDQIIEELQQLRARSRGAR